MTRGVSAETHVILNNFTVRVCNEHRRAYLIFETNGASLERFHTDGCNHYRWNGKSTWKTEIIFVKKY